MEWESPEDGTLTEIYVEEGGKVNGATRSHSSEAKAKRLPRRRRTRRKKQSRKPRKKETSAKKQAQAERRIPRPKKGNLAAPPQESKKEAKPAEERSLHARQTGRRGEDGKTGEARVKASPLARRVAGELGVDLSIVKGTGPEGRVTETDVRAACEIQGTPKAPLPRFSLAKAPASISAACAK